MKKMIIHQFAVTREEKKIVNAVAIVLSKKHEALINLFYEIAYRKVTIIDDYGDENWDVLNKEVSVLMRKIAKKEEIDGDDGGCARSALRGGGAKNAIIFSPYRELRSKLITSFKKYYQLRKGDTSKNKDVSKMSGVDFETHIADLLKESGFTDVIGTPKTGDQGADIIAKKNNKTIVIQAKRYEGNVGNKAIQEVIGAVRFYDGDEGWVITNSKFTKSARELASKNNVRLVDGSDLEQFKKIV